MQHTKFVLTLGFSNTTRDPEMSKESYLDGKEDHMIHRGSRTMAVMDEMFVFLPRFMC